MPIHPPLSTPSHASRRPWAFARWLAPLLLAASPALLGVASVSAQTSADSTITLTLTASGGDGSVRTATSYALRYRTVGITGVDTTSWWSAATPVTGLPTPRAAGSRDSMIVRGLTPLTTYYFVLRVGDEVPNWSAFSNLAVKTTTGDATPPAAVADLAVTSVTGTSIAVRWTAPGDDGTTGTATSYDIRYSTSAITASNWASATQVSAEPVPTAAGTQQTYTISGLAGSRTYYIALKATDDAGNISNLSNVPSGTTADTIAPSAVRDLSMDPDSNPVDPIVYENSVIELGSNAR